MNTFTLLDYTVLAFVTPLVAFFLYSLGLVWRMRFRRWRWLRLQRAAAWRTVEMVEAGGPVHMIDGAMRAQGRAMRAHRRYVAACKAAGVQP